MMKVSREQLAKGRERAKEKLEIDSKRFLEGASYYEKKHFNQLAPNHRRRWLDAFNGVPSLKNAIIAKCQDCSSYQKEEITNCTVRICPLWKYRPYSKHEEDCR